MNYDFIKDEEELQRFIDGVVPELEAEESFLLILGARKKYLNEAEQSDFALTGTDVFRREVISKKENIRPRVEELCVEQGLYRDRKGKPLPEHCFSVYLTINPRSQRKAAVALAKEIADRLYDGQRIRLERMAKSQLHKAISRKIFLDLDVDPTGGDDAMEVVHQIRSVLGSTPHQVIKTRTGAHVIVQTKRLDPSIKKTFYRDIQTISRRMEGEIEVRNDAMLPLPGTSQGGVAPKWIQFEVDTEMGLR